MGLPTHGTAGSMPEETLARGTSAFDDEFLAGSDLSDFQREVARKLLSIAETLPAGSLSARAAIGRIAWPSGLTLLVNFVPRDETCAEMTIYIGRNTFVHIGAGSATTFGLPNAVWDQRAKDVPGLTEKIVDSVATGNLRETIHYSGDTVVRSESVLNVDGVPVSVDRTDVGVVLRCVFRKRTRREVVYPPYC